MKLLYDGWLKIYQVKMMIKGKLVDRELLIMKDAVGAVITDERGHIGLVEQSRPGIDKKLFEIPAGVLDKEGLSPKEVLIEELEEECELTLDEILFFNDKPIHSYLMSAGCSKSIMQLFRVKVKQQPNEKIVEDVDVERVVWVSLADFERMIETGQVMDNKTILAYYILKGEM